jgi:hypothetical protein
MHNAKVSQTGSNFTDSWYIRNQRGVKRKYYHYIPVFPLESHNLITCDMSGRGGEETREITTLQEGWEAPLHYAINYSVIPEGGLNNRTEHHGH